MRNVFTIFIIVLFSITFVNAQTDKSDIRLRMEFGSENSDLMSILRFEEIDLEKMIFTGNDLKNKDYQISIKKIVNGNLEKQEIVLDSKESDYFKIKSNRFIFRFLAKTTLEPKAVFEFQFNGFSKKVEYNVEKTNNDFHRKFALKDFLGDQPDTAISVNAGNYVLAYMMPYVRKDGSASYCEVAQSGVNPEDLGKKYAIPTYFLIDIKFY